MKRKQLKFTAYGLIIVLIAALLVITASCSCGTKATTTSSGAVSGGVSTTKSAVGAVTTTQYTNPLYGLKVPSQWTVNSANAKDITVNSSSATAYVRILTSIGSVASLDSYLSSCVSLLKLEFPAYAEQSRSKITVNGLPAYSLNITFTKSGVATKAIMYVIVKGTQGYCAVGMATPTEWNKYSADLTAILNSVKPN